MDIPIWTIAGWLFAPAFATVLGMYIERKKRDAEQRTAYAEKQRKHDEAVDRALKVTLRKDLVDSYEKYVVDGKPLTVERMHEITESFHAYTELGGNGTGKTMYEAVSNVPIAIMQETKERL